MAGRAPLLDLPAELYENIFGHFDTFPREPHWASSAGTVRIQTLLSICLTCRALHQVALPALLHNIEITTADRDDYAAVSNNRDFEEIPRTLKLLLRSVKAKPYLFKNTKRLLLKLSSLRLLEKNIDDLPPRGKPTKILDWLLWMFQQMPNLVELDFRSDARYLFLWRDILEEKPGILPKLKVLRIGPHHNNLAHVYSSDIGRFVTPTRYGRARERTDGYYRWHFARTSTFNFEDYHPLFGREGLQHLSLTFAATMYQCQHYPGAQKWSALELLRGAASLTSLELWRCFLPDRSLITILQACPKLKVLKVDAPQDASVVDGFKNRLRYDDHERPVLCDRDDTFSVDVMNEISPLRVQEALDHCKATLQDLSLRYYRPLLPAESKLCFRDFSQLRKLIIQGDDLDYEDGLPPTLQELTILEAPLDHWYKNKWDDITDLRFAGQVPRLQYLRLISCEGKRAERVLAQLDGKKNYKHPLPGGKWERRTYLRGVRFVANEVRIEVMEDGHRKTGYSREVHEYHPQPRPTGTGDYIDFGFVVDSDSE